MERGYGHGQEQRGWHETDERILFGFIKAVRRGDYDAALEMAHTDEAMADWPAKRRGEWKAWVELTRLMKGQRNCELEARRKAGENEAGRRLYYGVGGS